MIITLVTNVSEFYNLHEEWDILLKNSSADSPFLSHQWLQSWWEVYGHGELHIITCRDPASRELVGVLPLFRFRTGALPTVTMLRFLGSEHISSDFLDCLARRGWEDRVFSACLAALLNNTSKWDVIELQDMDEASPFCTFMAGADIPKLEMIRDTGKRCPFLVFPESWDVLLKGLSRKMRQRIGNRSRALELAGTVELERVTDPASIREAIDDLFRLRLDRLEQKRVSLERITSDYRRFHSLAMERLLSCGRLRLYFLRINGKRVAFTCFFSGSDRLFYYQTGFDRNWGKHSVGYVLLNMAVEQAINDGLAVIEFLRGQQPYKYDWTTTERQLVDLIIRGRSISARIYQLRHSLKSMLVRIARQVLTEKLRLFFKKQVRSFNKEHTKASH